LVAETHSNKAKSIVLLSIVPPTSKPAKFGLNSTCAFWRGQERASVMGLLWSNYNVRPLHHQLVSVMGLLWSNYNVRPLHLQLVSVMGLLLSNNVRPLHHQLVSVMGLLWSNNVRPLHHQLVRVDIRGERHMQQNTARAAEIALQLARYNTSLKAWMRDP
jgi:hypothetical protein